MSNRRRSKQTWPYVQTLLLFTFVTSLCAAAEPYLGYRSIGFIFLLCILLLGTFASMGPVLFASLYSAAAWNYFFIPPRFTFVIRSSDDAIMCLAYLVVAVITGYLTHQIRQRERIIREREERTNVLYETLQEISQSAGKDEFLTKITERMGRILSGRCGVVLANAEKSARLRFDFEKPYALVLTAEAQAIASRCFESGELVEDTTDARGEVKLVSLPLRGLYERLGVFVYESKRTRRLSSDEQALLSSVCGQLGRSLEHHFVRKRLAESRRLEESEKLHQTLLSSISHELRTPLTSIMGAASSLEAGTAADNPALVRNLASQLTDSTSRLNRVIENLLDMSRLNSGRLALNLEWQDPSDLVGVVLKKLEKELSGRNVQLRIPADAPLVRMDFRLMEHALSNLVLNAATYTPQTAPIRIAAALAETSLLIEVEDGGAGIPLADRELVFEKFYRVPGTPAGGTGLGLSIVKSIVEAHGGLIRVETSELGGARFTIVLARLEAPPAAPEEESS